LYAPVIHGNNNQDGVSLKIVSTTEKDAPQLGGIGFYEAISGLSNTERCEEIDVTFKVTYEITEVAVKDPETDQSIPATISINNSSVNIKINGFFENDLIAIIKSRNEVNDEIYEDQFNIKAKSNDLLTVLLTNNGFYHFHNTER
jgi:hypothetical protein